MSRARERYRQQVYAAYGLTDCPPRFATLRDIRRPTLGPKVARIAAALGHPPGPWHRYVLDTALELWPDTGLPVYRDVGITVPRQQGKTMGVGLPVAVHRGLAYQQQRIVYAAQSGTAAREKWEDDHVGALIEAGWAPNPDLNEPLLPSHKARIRKANGREAIIWRRTRSIHGLHANTESKGHGKTLHLGWLDELFAQVDDRIHAAWSPAMYTVPSAQSWWMSTKGTARSVPLNEAIKYGRQLTEAGVQRGTFYIEWSAPRRSDRTDRRVWLSCMPSLCPTPGPCQCSPHWRHTVTLEVVQHDLDKATTPSKLAEFDRAALNITREDSDMPDPRVPTVEAWSLLADDRPVEASSVAIGIDAYNGYAAIVAVGLLPDDIHGVAVIEHGPGDDWVVERAVRIRDDGMPGRPDLKPVAWAVDNRSEAAKLIPRMVRAGWQLMSTKEPQFGGLWVPQTTDVGAATANFTDRVNGGRLVHTGQTELTQAIAVARTRPIGDGAYAYGRRVSSADITPLSAAALGDAALDRYSDLVPERVSIYETRGLTLLGGGDDLEVDDDDAGVD